MLKVDPSRRPDTDDLLSSNIVKKRYKGEYEYDREEEDEFDELLQCLVISRQCIVQIGDNQPVKFGKSTRGRFVGQHGCGRVLQDILQVPQVTLRVVIPGVMFTGACDSVGGPVGPLLRLGEDTEQSVFDGLFIERIDEQTVLTIGDNVPWTAIVGGDGSDVQLRNDVAGGVDVLTDLDAVENLIGLK